MDSEQFKKVWKNKALAMGYSAAASLLSQLYPVDFEAYMLMLELTDSRGKTLDYFSFPIMPQQLSVQEDVPVKVMNTFGGVNTISSSVFVPKDIQINGNFGRNFKMLIRSKIVVPLVHKMITERDYGAGTQKKELEVFNMLKTGYGCTKVLQSIINRSVEVDKYGECNKLYFYNFAFGESYVVKPINFRYSQDIGMNGIWKYDLNMKAVCPLHLDAHKQGKHNKAMILATSQAILNTALNGARDLIRN